MSNKFKTKADLARMAGVSRPTFYKELKILLSDPKAREVLKSYKPRLGFTPSQIDFITENLHFFK